MSDFVMRLTERENRNVLAAAIGVFVVIVSAVGFWKYAHYRYQGLDLAIYTNVLWNLSHGNGWWSSIQGNSYLGDHIEPALLLLVPLFRLWSDPRLLIIVQVLALGLTAVPVFLLLRALDRAANRLSPPTPPPHAMGKGGKEEHILYGEGGERNGMRWQNDSPPSLLRGEGGQGGRGAIALAMLWLINPLIWNAALFEFHALAFAPVLVLTAAYFFIQRKFWWFLAFATASVFVREDIALVIAMFGIVSVVDRWSQWRGGKRLALRSSKSEVGGWRWIITPIILGIGWFIIATQIGVAHNLAGSYKFLTYYSWIARPEFFGQPISGFFTVVWGAISQPLRVLRHLATVGNFDMLFGLFMPFVFLPFLRPKWLILAIPPALQILLSGTGGNELVITLHYSLLFIPALVLATRDGLITWFMVEENPNATNTIRMPRMREWVERRLPHFPRRLAIGMGVGWVLAVAVTIGPFQGIADLFIRGASADDRARRAAYDELLARIPADAPVAASYAALPRVAARRDAMNMEYTYLGVMQFAEATYELPKNTAYLVMDARDARAYAVQFRDVAWARPHAAGGAERLRKLIAERGFRVIAERDDIALLARDPSGAALDDRYIEAKEVPRGMLLVDDLRDIRLMEE